MAARFIKKRCFHVEIGFLMRYYTKCTKSIEQIENLLKLAVIHHDESINMADENNVNICADRSFLNYMYNSKFSFQCQCNKDYSYEQMKADLKQIEKFKLILLFIIIILF